MIDVMEQEDWTDFSIMTVAHELKTPLALMRQLALSYEFVESAERRARIASEIVQISERSLRQVEDYLSLSRFEDALFEMEAVNPRVICDEVTQELGPSFEISYRNKNSLVVANKRMLFSVVYNFCNNAQKYARNDQKIKLSVYDLVKKQQVRIAVRDFGPALPMDVWRKIRSGKPLKPARLSMRPASSGFGLFIASSFVKQMHGEIGAIRHRDGTSFYADFPVSGQMSLL